MNIMRKLTMEDLQSGTLEGITPEEIHYNGFMGEITFTEPKPGQIKVACADSLALYFGKFIVLAQLQLPFL